MGHSFTDLIALTALLLWPAIPLFWVPVHSAPRFFRRLGFLTYLLPFLTWLPVAFLTFGLREHLIAYRIALPATANALDVLLFVLGAGLQAWTIILLTMPGIMGMPEMTRAGQARLVTAGPFGVLRHPTYLSHTLMLADLFLCTETAALSPWPSLTRSS